METPKYKYPRTFHIPGSPGATSDDKILKSLDHFKGKRVIITEKMDGENTSLYRDYFFMLGLLMDTRIHPKLG